MFQTTHLVKIKSQGKSQSLWIHQNNHGYPIGLIIGHTNHIMELVNKWFITGNFRNVDTPFRKESTYEKKLWTELPLTIKSFHKSEMEYHRETGHTLGRIQHISLMRRNDIFFTACSLATHTLAPTIPVFQDIKSCIQCLYSHPQKPIFIFLLIIMAHLVSDSHVVRIKLKTTQPRIVYNSINMRIIL